MRATELHATTRGGSAALLEVCCLRLMTKDDADDGWMQDGDVALQLLGLLPVLLLLFCPPAGVETKQNVKQRLQRLLIRCSLC